MSDPLIKMVAESIKDRLSEPETTADDLNGILWDLLYLRASVLGRELKDHLGSTVQGGLFKGMALFPNTTEGGFLPRLIGCYEQALQDHLKTMLSEATPRVINIGCNIGYYAIGIKRLWPNLEVIASDIDAEALKGCAEMAAVNQVTLTLVGRLSHADINTFAEPPGTIILSDIEGEEEHLLDPDLIPNLRHCPMLVELHGSAIDAVPERFLETHDVTILRQSTKMVQRPDVLPNITDVDLALLQWEMRFSETPWAVMTPKQIA